MYFYFQWHRERTALKALYPIQLPPQLLGTAEHSEAEYLPTTSTLRCGGSREICLLPS